MINDKDKDNKVESKKEEKKDNSNDFGPPPPGNGGKTDRYEWTQTLKEVTICIDVPKDTRPKEINVEFEAKHLKISLRGKSIIDDEFSDKIDTDNVTWTLDEERNKIDKTLTLVLPKNGKWMGWWPHVFVNDPKIKTSAIPGENSNVNELDSETRQAVEKVMFEQRQKQMGLPSLEDQKKNDALKKFMAAHPEMDFSKAKIS